MTAARNRPALIAFAWTAFFILWHGYWALGGDFGFGDQESGFPDAGWLFTVVVAGLFAAGLAVPLAIARDVGPRRLLRGLLWIGAVVLAARGVAGLADDALRFSGAAETGLTGLSDAQVLGSANPSAYTIWSTIGIDSFFALGGGLFAWAAQRSAPARLPRLPWATVVVWIAILAPLPYSLSRLLWAAGVPIGISEQGLDDLGSPGWGSLVLVALAVLTEATALIVHHFVWRRERTLRGRPVRPRLVVASLLAPVVILTYANAITAAGVLGVFDAAESGLHGDDWGVPMTGILFWIWGLALTATTIVYHRRTREAAVPGRGPRSLAWAAYAACGWAIAYAVGVRGYQGLGGTVGLAGTFKDPGAMRHASLLAGAAIFVLGLGALSFVRPWGLLLPRWPLIGFALVGSAYSMAHALTAYVTKPLDLLGVIDMEFSGWAQRDDGAQALWDLLFYEPWFLGLGLLVTLGTLHHHRRTGGSAAARRRLVAGTAVATVALTVVACTMVISQA